MRLEEYMVYGYIRVSTDKHTVENQHFEIQRFCTKNGLAVGAQSVYDYVDTQTTFWFYGTSIIRICCA
jgi:DNA invertase Pin-like site-specific DNA recombinase